MTSFVECEITLHDYLFFATHEIGRLYETGGAIHNYALCYALGLVNSNYFCAEQTPTYQQDLSLLNERGIYITPAQAREVFFSISTWKYASNYYHVEMEKNQNNTPSFGRIKEIAPESKFRFFIVSEKEDFLPSHWIRLGKWLSKAELKIKNIHKGKLYQAGDFYSEIMLNPLDVPSTCSLQQCNVLNMPPSSLIEKATLNGAHWKLTDKLNIPANLQFGFPKR